MLFAAALALVSLVVLAPRAAHACGDCNSTNNCIGDAGSINGCVSVCDNQGCVCETVVNACDAGGGGDPGDGLPRRHSATQAWDEDYARAQVRQILATPMREPDRLHALADWMTASQLASWCASVPDCHINLPLAPTEVLGHRWGKLKTLYR
jgi:hypothetical protein